MAKPEGPPAPPIAEGALDPLAPQGPPAPLVPQAPNAIQVPPQPVPHIPPCNWSHFKPEFTGKPDEDTEALLLRMNGWMDTHRSQDNDKVQRFCLTLTGEAKLSYASFRLINEDILGL